MSYYPISKGDAIAMSQMFDTPAWASYVRCILHEAEINREAALQTEYGPYAIEKFRFNQGIAQNLTRIVQGVIEEVNNVLADNEPLSSLDVEDLLSDF